jgi:hypothetical protein
VLCQDHRSGVGHGARARGAPCMACPGSGEGRRRDWTPLAADRRPIAVAIEGGILLEHALRL